MHFLILLTSLALVSPAMAVSNMARSRDRHRNKEDSYSMLGRPIIATRPHEHLSSVPWLDRRTLPSEAQILTEGNQRRLGATVNDGPWDFWQTKVYALGGRPIKTFRPSPLGPDLRPSSGDSKPTTQRISSHSTTLKADNPDFEGRIVGAGQRVKFKSNTDKGTGSFQVHGPGYLRYTSQTFSNSESKPVAVSQHLDVGQVHDIAVQRNTELSGKIDRGSGRINPMVNGYFKGQATTKIKSKGAELM